MATLTGNSRRREQRIQSAMLDRLTAKFERRIAREISRAMKSAADQVESGNAFSIRQHEQNMTRILNILWRDSMLTFAERLAPAKSNRGPQVVKKKQVISPATVVDKLMTEWSQRFSFQKITEITETTRSDIEAVVSSGIIAGESERDIAKWIQAVTPTKSASRAQTIARTETHGAANAGAQATAEAAGGEFKRVWVASGGGRTRDTHDDADGQEVAMNEPFKVGRARLMFPGDPSGPAKEVINCRCAVAFEIVR